MPKKGTDNSALGPKKSFKERVANLQKLVKLRERQLHLAQLEQCRLVFKHQLLVGCVDSLGSILKHGRWQQQQQQEELPCTAANPSFTGATEQLLLAQLAELPCSSRLQQPLAAEAAELASIELESEAGSSSSVNLLQGTLAPAGDPFFGLRWLLTQPLLPGAATLTVPEMLADYAQTVRELSLCVHWHNTNQVQQQQQQQQLEQQTPVTKMKAVIFRHFHLIASLCLLRRWDISNTMCLKNHETGEVGSEQVITDRHRLAVRQAGLSSEQQQLIVQGCAVVAEVLETAEQECRQLQQQLGVGLALPEALANKTLLQHLTSSNSQLEKADRLLLLLRKVSLLRIGMASVVYGALTPLQLAQIVVCTSPYVVSPATLVAAIKELSEQRTELGKKSPRQPPPQQNEKDKQQPQQHQQWLDGLSSHVQSMMGTSSTTS